MPRQRPQPMADADRRLLLDAARRAFAEHGFERASLNHVLHDLSLSKGAFYYHFDGKHDLFLAVVRDTLGPILTATGVPGPAADADAFWADLDAYLDASSRAFQEHPEAAGILRAAASLLNDPSWAKRFGDLRRGMLDVAVAVVEDGRRVGAVRTDVPAELLASVVYAAMEQVDQYVLHHWDDLSAADVARWSVLGRDLVRRIAAPSESLGVSP